MPKVSLSVSGMKSPGRLIPASPFNNLSDAGVTPPVRARFS